MAQHFFLGLRPKQTAGLSNEGSLGCGHTPPSGPAQQPAAHSLLHSALVSLDVALGVMELEAAPLRSEHLLFSACTLCSFRSGDFDVAPFEFQILVIIQIHQLSTLLLTLTDK